MLISVLYNDLGEVVATAPACDQIPEGNAYWANQLDVPQSNQSWGETAVHDIQDPEVLDQMLAFSLEPQLQPEIQNRWDRYCQQLQERQVAGRIGTPQVGPTRFEEGRKPGSKIVHPKAA